MWLGCDLWSSWVKYGAAADRDEGQELLWIHDQNVTNIREKKETLLKINCHGQMTKCRVTLAKYPPCKSWFEEVHSICVCKKKKKKKKLFPVILRFVRVAQKKIFFFKKRCCFAAFDVLPSLGGTSSQMATFKYFHLASRKKCGWRRR